LSTDNLADLHFDQALRGYRMNEVDEVIDALTARLQELESLVASLAVHGEATQAAGEATQAAGEAGDVSGEPQE
jgi:DivIVA domain-containing protein